MTLAYLCEVLAGNLQDAEVWTACGYLFIRTDNGTWRLSLDKVPASANRLTRP